MRSIQIIESLKSTPTALREVEASHSMFGYKGVGMILYMVGPKMAAMV